jgi:hypothetical protein
MNLNEIKEAILEQDRDALLSSINKNGIVYTSYVIERFKDKESKIVLLIFKIPLEEIEDKTFEEVMSSRLLIKYLTKT